MRNFLTKSCVIGLFVLGHASHAATTLVPGIIAVEDFSATPESVQVVSVNNFLEDETLNLNLEVYELEPGLYRFVGDPASKTDEALLNSEGVTGPHVVVSEMISDSGADGILLRGKGSYPGAVSISFGLPRDYPDLPRDAIGDVDIDAAIALTGPDAPAQFYAGRSFIEVDGVILVLENLSIGDHAANNRGVLQSAGDSPVLVCNNVWIYNVYDGVFWYNSGVGTARFENCIFYGTFQPWSSAAERDAAGYTFDGSNQSGAWDLIVPGRPGDVYGLGQGELYDDTLFLPVGTHPGVRTGNDVIGAFNANLFTTECDTAVIKILQSTIVKHDTRTNYTWRHNSGLIDVLFIDSNIIGLDGPDTPGGNPGEFQFRNIENGEWFGKMLNTKWWNYATGDVNLNPDPGLWANGWENFLDWTFSDPSATAAKVDLVTPGGLNISDAAELIPLDARKLTSFKSGAMELTLASDGGPVGYRLPANAPSGPLSVVTVVPRPITVSVTLSAGVVTIDWNAQPGKTYRLEYKSDLGEMNWQDLTGEITATGDTASKADLSMVGPTQRFYRVRQLP